MKKIDCLAALFFIVSAISTTSLQGFPMETKESDRQAREGGNPLSAGERTNQPRRATDSNDRSSGESRGMELGGVDQALANEDAAEERGLTREEQLLYNQAKEALIQQVGRTPENQTHYNQADEYLRKLDEALKQLTSSYQELQSSFQTVELSEQRLKRAQLTNTEEERQKTILSKIAECTSKLASIFQNIPDPNVQGAAGGIAIIGEIAELFNKAWAQFNETAAQVLHEEYVLQNHQERLNRANQDLKDISDIKQAVSEAEQKDRKKTFELLKQLSPQKSWEVFEWERWSKLITSDNAQVGKLIKFGESHLREARKLGSDAWQARIKAVKQEFLQLKSEKNEILNTLYLKYHQAKYDANRAADKVTQFEEILRDEKQNQSLEDVKEKIQKLISLIIELRNTDLVACHNKIDSFLENLNLLCKMYSDFSSQKIALEQARDAESDAKEILWQHSQCCYLYKELIMAKYKRAKLKLRVDQEAWRDHWLPIFHEQDYQIRLPEEIEAILPPPYFLNQLEAQGRVMRLYQPHQVELASTTVVPTNEVTATNPLTALEQVMKRVTNSDWLKQAHSNVQQRWNTRWNILEEVEKLEEEMKQVRKNLVKEEEKEDELRNLQREKTEEERSSLVSIQKNIQELLQEWSSLHEKQQQKNNEWGQFQKQEEQERKQKEGESAFRDDDQSWKAWRVADLTVIEERLSKAKEKESVNSRLSLQKREDPLGKQELISLAAKQYHEGNPSLWFYGLNKQERTNYKTTAKQENNEYEESLRDQAEVISGLKTRLQENTCSPDAHQELERQLQNLQAQQDQRQDDLAKGKAYFQEIEEQTKERKNQSLEKIRNECDELQNLASESTAKAMSLPPSYEKDFWNASSDSLSQAIEYLKNLIKSISQHKDDVATLWREAADQSKEAAEAMADKNENEGLKLCVIAKLSRVKARDAQYRVQAIEAAKYRAQANEDEAKRNSKLAESWQGVAETQQRSIDRYLKAAEAYAAGKTNEGNIWFCMGDGFYYAAEKLGNAIGAEVERKPDVAGKWREAAKFYERSTTAYKYGIQAYPPKKIDDLTCWSMTFGSRKTKEGHALNSAGHSLQKLGFVRCMAIQAELDQKLDIAEKWMGIASLDERALESYREAALAYKTGKSANGLGWFQAGGNFDNSACALVKAIEADEVWKIEVSQLWREAAANYEESGEKWKKSEEVRVEDTFSNEMQSTWLRTNAIILASKAKKLATEAEKM